jgi:hypothetical protein
MKLSGCGNRWTGNRVDVVRCSLLFARAADDKKRNMTMRKQAHCGAHRTFLEIKLFVTPN